MGRSLFQETLFSAGTHINSLKSICLKLLLVVVSFKRHDNLATNNLKFICSLLSNFTLLVCIFRRIFLHLGVEKDGLL